MLKTPFWELSQGSRAVSSQDFFPQWLPKPLVAASIQKNLFFIRQGSLLWTPIFSPWLLRWKDAWDKNTEHDMEIVHIINHHWWFLNIYDIDYQNDQPKNKFCQDNIPILQHVLWVETDHFTAVFSLTIPCWGPLMLPLTVKDYISMGGQDAIDSQDRREFMFSLTGKILTEP